jgi:hypothetical protein
MKAGHIDSVETAERQNLAGMRVLASIPDALWVSYEAMVGNQYIQIANIAKFLGVDALDTHIDWTDENEKWLTDSKY